MILLKKVRLINWYGFSNVTAPIGRFTLIAGKNGNGKSVMLDAIKYAAYGDTVFNKSSESKGSRTLSSYTRGLLDATAGTYMRPADQVPNVYSHIVLEYFDEVEEKSFLLGTVIETNAANNCLTYRYVMDHAVMEDMEHTYIEEGVTLPCSASLLQKKYRLILMNREQGLPKFMQMTGLKLSLGQVPTYLRKLRGIMSYDPDARIDQFIRESVLEKRDVDFGKLIEAKKNIEQLNDDFERIQQEIDALDGILSEYDTWETMRNRLLSDDIRIVYKKTKDLKVELKRQADERTQAQQRKEDIEKELRILDARKKEADAQLVQAKVSLERLDSMRMIAEEERRLDALEEEKRDFADRCKKLEAFQTVVSELMNLFAEGVEASGRSRQADAAGRAGEKACDDSSLYPARKQTPPKTDAVESLKEQFLRENGPVEDREILAALCGQDYAAARKATAVSKLKQRADLLYDVLVGTINYIQRRTKELNQSLDAQYRIIEECKRHQNAYGQIPEYVGLRDEINREFDKRKITARAQFACEYVIGLADENWRDAIEAFLGPRRYTILVDPAYYDIADDVLNRSQYRYAHLFNTKLLMKREMTIEEDSAVSMLDIKNPVAKRYFDFQLGRMHAVALEEVRNFENAISKEGRVSVAMDSYFLRFDRIHSYYLGQKTFELNQIRAEREIERLQEEKRHLLSDQKDLEALKSILTQDRDFFREYDYDAHSKYQEAAEQARRSQTQLKRLKKAQENNQEYIELNELVARLQEEQQAVQAAYSENYKESSRQETIILRCAEMIEVRSAELAVQEKQFEEYQIQYYTLVKKTTESYDKYLENGKTGPGGPVAEGTRKRMAQSIEQHKSLLMQRQADYLADPNRSGDMLPRGTDGRELYAARRERIWMDNLQEIREKLESQTRRYEDIFKNEFVLTILKSCERAREDLRMINRELAKLDFSAKYQFDVHYVHDGSEYAKIIEYAKYLDEREQLGGTDGQMTFDILTSISDEEGEELEKEMKRIVNRIIETNSEETIARFADYRNYMTYEILISNAVLDHAKLSRQTGYNSGAEVQIPYLLILCSALLLIYNQRVNSTRMVFIDEPFGKMDPGNVKRMLRFMRDQNLQVIFCSPDKTETIGNACDVILPALRVRADSMQLGIVQFH